MSIQSVYIYWCQHKAKCKWCEQTIEAGEPIIRVTFWNKGDENKRSWNIKRYYHPQCWIDQGLDYLKLNPYVAYQRKPKSTLSSEDKELRYKLLRRKASIDQRLRSINSNPLEIARLNENISKIMIEIALVGGVPKKWLE